MQARSRRHLLNGSKRLKNFLLVYLDQFMTVFADRGYKSSGMNVDVPLSKDRFHKIPSHFFMSFDTPIFDNLATSPSSDYFGVSSSCLNNIVIDLLTSCVCLS